MKYDSDYIHEQLSPPSARFRFAGMFGDAGAYCDGLFCAILEEDSLYLKADDASSEHFRQVGQSSFSYQRKDGKQISMKFYSPR